MRQYLTKQRQSVILITIYKDKMRQYLTKQRQSTICSST